VRTPTRENAALVRAKEQVTRVLGERAGRVLPYLEHAEGIEGSDSLFRRISRAPDKNAIFECAAEIAFAWGFECTGRAPKFVQPRKKERRPDLRVSDNEHWAWVEVTRFRAAYAGEPTALPGGGLPLNLEDTEPHIRKFYEVINSKIAQIKEGCGSDNAILAIWSDHDDREDLEFRTAVGDIRWEAEEGSRRLPSGLLFAVLRAPSRNLSRDQRIYCEPFRELQEPFAKWSNDLENLGRARE